MQVWLCDCQICLWAYGFKLRSHCRIFCSVSSLTNWSLSGLVDGNSKTRVCVFLILDKWPSFVFVWFPCKSPLLFLFPDFRPQEILNFILEFSEATVSLKTHIVIECSKLVGTQLTTEEVSFLCVLLVLFSTFSFYIFHVCTNDVPCVYVYLYILAVTEFSLRCIHFSRSLLLFIFALRPLRTSGLSMLVGNRPWLFSREFTLS